MNRPSLAHVVATFALALIPIAARAQERQPPNVVIVMTDDQGYGDLGCHGNSVLKTPNLDKLHDESIRLTDFHVAPMCTPTRSQLLTGTHCFRNGAMNVSSGRALLRRGIPTLADVLGASGYACGIFGKWHLGDNYPYRPQDRGFHESVWFPSSHIGSAPDNWDNDYFDDVYTHNGDRQQYGGYTTDVYFTEAMEWMQARANERKPFFCYIPTAAPHAPLFVPQRYRDMYKDQPPRVASFFGMIANIDENVGKLMAFLEREGLDRDTILVFLTDNGGTAGVPVFNAGMRGTKVTLYEGGHRVPCFIRWPEGGLSDPRDIAGLTQAQDLMPTLLDLCGVAPPPSAAFDGINLGPLLRAPQGDAPVDRMLVVNFSRMNAPVPQKDWSAVLWRKWRLVDNRELYDLSADPMQQTNVINAHPDVTAKMRAHLDAWWAAVLPHVDEHEPIVIGSGAEPVTQLSPADWEDSFFDQGQQVRSGYARNGVWNLEVATSGEYEFELRRWPREVDAPITAGLPPVKHWDGTFPEGTALPVGRARLKTTRFDETVKVTPDVKFVRLRVELPRGRARLQTWFQAADGAELCGAYYVYVTRSKG